MSALKLWPLQLARELLELVGSCCTCNMAAETKSTHALAGTDTHLSAPKIIGTVRNEQQRKGAPMQKPGVYEARASYTCMTWPATGERDCLLNPLPPSGA